MTQRCAAKKAGGVRCKGFVKKGQKYCGPHLSKGLKKDLRDAEASAVLGQVIALEKALEREFDRRISE